MLLLYYSAAAEIYSVLHFPNLFTESSVIFFMEWGFDPYWKREQGSWCNLFWDKDSKEKEQGIITKNPIKNLWKLSIMEKNKNIFWFVNNSEYRHQKMGLYCEKELF